MNFHQIMYCTGIILFIIKIPHSKTRWCLYFSGSGIETFIRGEKNSGKLVVVKRKGEKMMLKSHALLLLRQWTNTVCFNVKYFNIL